MVGCPPPNWKVGRSIRGPGVARRSAPWAREFTATAPAKASFRLRSAANWRQTNPSHCMRSIKKSFYLLPVLIYVNKCSLTAWLLDLIIPAVPMSTSIRKTGISCVVILASIYCSWHFMHASRLSEIRRMHVMFAVTLQPVLSFV